MYVQIFLPWQSIKVSKFYMPENMKSLNVFFFTSAGPAVALSGLILVLIALGIGDAFWEGLTWVVLMVLSRSFFEYLMHRYVWHRRSFCIAGIKVRNIVAEMHAQHHADPDNMTAVLYGWKSVLAGFVAIALLFGGVFGWFVGAVFAGIYSSYLLLHEWFHLLSHSGISPKSKALKDVIFRHRYHHYVNENKCFSVSQIWADKLFGTDAPFEAQKQ